MDIEEILAVHDPDDTYPEAVHTEEEVETVEVRQVYRAIREQAQEGVRLYSLLCKLTLNTLQPIASFGAPSGPE